LVESADGTMTEVVNILEKMISRKAVCDMTKIPDDLAALKEVLSRLKTSVPDAYDIVVKVLHMMIDGGSINDLNEVGPYFAKLSHSLAGLKPQGVAAAVKKTVGEVSSSKATIASQPDEPVAEAPKIRGREDQIEAVAVPTRENTQTIEAEPKAARGKHAPVHAPTSRVKPHLPKRPPAVPIRESVTNDYIICLEDGKKMKMLKRHLNTAYHLSPEEYIERWGLPSDYPMVAPNYAKQKSNYARSSGLGTSKMRQEVAAKREIVEA
jgi:predicted transcriptional regulator